MDRGKGELLNRSSQAPIDWPSFWLARTDDSLSGELIQANRGSAFAWWEQRSPISDVHGWDAYILRPTSDKGEIVNFVEGMWFVPDKSASEWEIIWKAQQQLFSAELRWTFAELLGDLEHIPRPLAADVVGNLTATSMTAAGWEQVKTRLFDFAFDGLTGCLGRVGGDLSDLGPPGSSESHEIAYKMPPSVMVSCVRLACSDVRGRLQEARDVLAPEQRSGRTLTVGPGGHALDVGDPATWAPTPKALTPRPNASDSPPPGPTLGPSPSLSDPVTALLVSAPAANQMGGADGMVAAEAVAFVFLSRYVPALYGALTMANVGMYGLKGAQFFEAMASDAYGSEWPWGGKDAFDESYEAKQAYIKAFASSLGRALESGATADRAIPDVAAELDVPANAPASSRRILHWTAAMDRLGQRAWADEERLEAERAAHRARGLPCGWILPAPRPMNWLERGSLGREFAIRVESAPDGYVATVRSLVFRPPRDVYRACFASRSDAEREAAAFVSVRWQITRLPHLRRLDECLDTAVLLEPFGKDALARLLRMADSVDRHARGIGIGVFNDDDAWQKIQAGDVAGLLARLPTLPFQLSMPSTPQTEVRERHPDGPISIPRSAKLG